VEDVPAGHREIALDVLRSLHLDARPAGGVGRETGRDRLDEVLVERGEGARDRELPGALGVPLEERGWGVDADVAQRVGPGRRAVEDRGVGEWQEISPGIADGTWPAAASAYAASSCV
jgi:hypothetical protein